MRLVQALLVLRGDLDVGHLPLRPRGDGEQHQGHEQRGHAQTVVIGGVGGVLGLGNDEPATPCPVATLSHHSPIAWEAKLLGARAVVVARPTGVRKSSATVWMT